MNYEMSQSLDFEDLTEEFKKRDLNDFLINCMDNNDGYFVIQVDDDLNISFGFLTGLGNTDKIKTVSSEEYLKLFTKETEDLKEEFDILEQFKQIDGLKMLRNFKKKLNRKKVRA